MAMNINIQGGYPQQQQPGFQPQPGMTMQPGMQPGMMMQQPMMGPGMQPGMMGPGPGMMQPGMMQPGFQPGMVMMQPGMMMPGNMVVQQIKYGKEKLAEQTGIFVKQKFQLMEALTGCDQENRYNVYKLSKDGMDKKGKPIFKAKEKSGFCSRQCCHPSCRPFDMDVNNEDVNETVDDTPFMKLVRPFTCTICCCNRPYMDVTFVERDANERMGVIKAPCTCYDVQVDVYNASEDLKYKIVANCCQLGFWCKCPCDPCQHIHFDIRNPGGDNVGNLEKYSQGCIKATMDDSDNFSVHFPDNITPDDKALLMAATLFMDFRFFEERPNGRN